jgi:hypothetical protein
MTTVLVIYMQIVHTNAHGYLKFPAARNVVANSDYCKQCLSAGGPSAVSNGASWPNGKHGICGDPYSQTRPRNHEAGGKYYGNGISQATFTSGDVIDLEVVLTAYHKGEFDFRICKINGITEEDETNQLTEECLDQHQLKQASIGSQIPGEARYFIGPSSSDWDYKMKYQLPAGLDCDGETSRCVLVWHYLTGNSCDPPNTPQQYSSPSLAVCGTGPYPEEFWNCADITILPRSTISPVPSSPVPPSPSPVPPSPVPPSPSPVPSTPSPVPPSPVPSSPVPSPSPPNDGGTPPSAEQFCAGKPYGFYADKTSNCANFYRCETVGSFYFPCPTGLLFNEAINVCDWPYNVPNC